jgi:uncharacterized protein (DUF2147 family)
MLTSSGGDRVVEKDGKTFKLDSRNPDPALRSRSTERIVLIKGLTWANGYYTGGSFYDASSGKSYRCKAEIKDSKLELRGYLGVSLLDRTLTLNRLD